MSLRFCFWTSMLSKSIHGDRWVKRSYHAATTLSTYPIHPSFHIFIHPSSFILFFCPFLCCNLLVWLLTRGKRGRAMIGKPWPMYPTRSPSRPLNVSRRLLVGHQSTSTYCIYFSMTNERLAPRSNKRMFPWQHTSPYQIDKIKLMQV